MNPYTTAGRGLESADAAPESSDQAQAPARFTFAEDGVAVYKPQTHGPRWQVSAFGRNVGI